MAGALRSLLVGQPRIPTHPSTDFPSPLSKLFAMSLCGVQLFAYLLAAVGGVTLWMLTHWQGWDDPLKGSLVGSIALEGWALVGPILGFIILFISRRWAIPTGVEWGWMGIRLGLLVFLVLFGSYLIGGLEQDVNISLITSVCLFIPALLFWQLGTTTIGTIKALSPENFEVRPKHLLQGEDLIFLSYRREDSQVWTDRIAEGLKGHFGRKAVFQDVEAILPGVDFRKHVQATLEQCQVIVVVIGPNWLSAKDNVGLPRLWEDQDWVRLEIEIGLERNLPIIPLLIAKATMPAQNELPETINDLAFQNALPIRTNPDFENDMQRFIQTLEGFLK